MPFDPNIPATNAEATSAMFRAQFNGGFAGGTALIGIEFHGVEVT
jgi:hypothetical protein